MIELGGSAVPAHSTQDFVLEVRPLAIGESVIVRPIEPLDDSWSGIFWTAWVSAENKITIRLANVTVLAANPTLRKFIAN
jgi:hypothetical protein